MHIAHALTLSVARSHIAALADGALTYEASVEYERVLLQLDFIHGDDTPALESTVGRIDDRGLLYNAASSAIEELLDHGVDGLQIEIVLDMLEVARDKDRA